MSLEFKSGSRTVVGVSFRNACCLLAMSIGFIAAGCGDVEPKEISAATSGYRPTKSADTKGSTSGSKAEKTLDAASSPGGEALTDLPAAPNVPAFQPGKLDPKIAAKPYMTMELGNLNGPKPLMEFLSASSRAFMELVADSRNKQIQLPQDVLLDRGMAVSRMKLEAAQRLEKLASTDDEKTAASLGTLEAYSQMASFKDLAAMDNLRELASKQMESDNKRVAQQAKAVAVGLLVSDYDAGITKANELTGLAIKILSDGSELNGPNLSSMMQAIDALSKHGDEEAATELAQKVEAGFRGHSENSLAMQAWKLYAGRLKETIEIGALAQSDTTEDQDPALAKAKVDALMAKIPSPWTAFFLVQIAVNIEYSGRPDVAKELVTAAATQIEKLKDPEAKSELQRNCDQFFKRSAILNKPLDMSELVDLTGKPVDWERYKGKVVLVDFWATWCGPCKAEIPNIEAMYAAYNKAGFEVIGVNLDRDRSELESFLNSKKLRWSTYVSSKPDAIEFETPLAKTIGISAIPFIAMVGKDGNVAAVHVRGRKLEAKIQELLAKE